MTERSGLVEVTGGRTFYRVVGSAAATPLVLLHGGPGSAHGYFGPLEALADERPIVFYDQLGSGQSDRPANDSLWTIERFLEELRQLRDALGLDEVHLLGHSWGAMLALDYVLGGAEGVRSLILSSPVVSASMWQADANRLRQELPEEVQATLRRHEDAGTTSSDAYKAAEREYYDRFVCRMDPPPEALLEVRKQSNREIYRLMWGTNEFSVEGTLRDYERMDRLHELDLPTLLCAGRYDESTPESLSIAFGRIRGAEMIIWPNSAHLAPLEEPARYVEGVRGFLRRVEGR